MKQAVSDYEKEVENMIKMVKGFVHRPGVHCVSSSLRDVFEFHGHKFSEEMVFGL